MNVKKAKRKCMVRGCRNTTDVYAVTCTREVGHTVIICAECAEKLYPSIEKFKAEYKEPEHREPKPSPFFNAGDKAENTETGTEFKCQYCDKVISSKIGLMSHEKACKNKINN